MKSFPKICLALMIGACSFAVLTPAGVAGEESYTLDNGLTVILCEMPGAGVVSGYLAFKVGSGDERDETEYGTAHLLEHLLFRNRARGGEGLVSDLVQENGGYVNAFTTKEMTAYTLSVPLEAALSLPAFLVDLTVNAHFAPEQLAEEQEIVVEEINGYADNADRQFAEFADEKYYGENHPYGRPIAGSPETVRGATGASVRAFHDRFYRPDNAVMVLAGEFDPAAMKQAVIEGAGVWLRPDAPLPDRIAKPAPRRDEPEAAIRVDARATLAKAFISFPSFSGRDDGALTASLLASVLSGGQASRLDARVWRDLELVYGVTAYTPVSAADGRLVVMLATRPDKLEPAVAAVFGVLDDLFADPPDETELERARSLLKMREFGSQDESGGVAMALVGAALTQGDWRARGLFGARLDAIGGGELLAAARTILSRRPLVAVMIPEGDDAAAAGLARNIENAVRGFAVPAGADPAHAAPEFVELEPLDGIRLAVMRDPNRNLVSAVAMARGGLLAETRDNNGIGRLMADAWTKSTAGKPSRTLSREMEQLGASIDAAGDAMTVSLSGGFLGDNWRESLRLFAEVLARPAFAASDVEEARRDLLAWLSQREQNLNGRVAQLANEAQYAGHPFSLEPDGREEVIAKLGPDDLAAWHRRLVRDGDLVVAVAGDIDPAEARAILADGLRGWRDGGEKSSVAVPPAPPVPDGPVATTKEIDRTQTHLALAFPAPDMYSPDREAMKVLETALNGLSGTLMTELRERRKLAYTTYSSYRPALGVGGMRFYISSEASKTGAALEGMEDVVRGLIANGLPEREVAAAKRRFVGEFRIFGQTLERKTAQAAFNLVNGRPVDYQELHIERIKAVTAGDVRRVIADYLSPDRAITAVLGPKASLDRVPTHVKE